MDNLHFATKTKTAVAPSTPDSKSKPKPVDKKPEPVKATPPPTKLPTPAADEESEGDDDFEPGKGNASSGEDAPAPAPEGDEDEDEEIKKELEKLSEPKPKSNGDSESKSNGDSEVKSKADSEETTPEHKDKSMTFTNSKGEKEVLRCALVQDTEENYIAIKDFFEACGMPNHTQASKSFDATNKAVRFKVKGTPLRFIPMSVALNLMKSEKFTESKDTSSVMKLLETPKFDSVLGKRAVKKTDESQPAKKKKKKNNGKAEAIPATEEEEVELILVQDEMKTMKRLMDGIYGFASSVPVVLRQDFLISLRKTMREFSRYT